MFPRTWYAGNRVAEKNSSRKLADQARLPTPRYRIGVRVYECRLPRRTLLGSSVNREAIPKAERSPPTSDYYSGPNGSPSASASAPKILTAGSAQGMSSVGASVMVGLSGGQSPEGMSLLTSTTTVASSSGW